MTEFVSYDHGIGACVECNAFSPFSINGSSKVINTKDDRYIQFERIVTHMKSYVYGILQCTL